MLCVFLFYIDYTIYANHVLKQNQQCLTIYIEIIIKYSVIWIPSGLTVFSFRTVILEVKVVQSYINKYIKHSFLPCV